MPHLTPRPYRGLDDLRAMQDAAARAFDHTWWRTGDVAWAARNRAQLELSVWVTLWVDERGAPAAWVWPDPNGHADVFVAPEADDPALVEEIVLTAEATLRRASQAGDTVSQLHVLAAENEATLLAALQRTGLQKRPTTLDVNRRSLETTEAPTSPAGMHFSGVTDDLVLGRVEAHRAAFAPSTLTLQNYQRVRRLPGYRAELDRVVVEDSSGRVVACCTAWLDEKNRSGLLEPVGTHPEYQHRGLGTAVCLDALTALAAAGAITAQVSCQAGESWGCATYRRAGFSKVLEVGLYSKDL